jgi:hypothetical protein
MLFFVYVVSCCRLECFGLSGIVTIFMAGVTLAHYAWYSLTHSAQITTKVTLSSLSDISEGFAFAYVGLSLWGFASESFHVPFAVYMLIVVIASRCATIFGMCWALKGLSDEFDLPVNEKVGFVLGGIVRGCLCWAQILQLYHSSDDGSEEKVVVMMIKTTLLIVMVKIVGCGILLPAIIPRLIPTDSASADKGEARTYRNKQLDPTAVALFPEGGNSNTSVINTVITKNRNHNGNNNHVYTAPNTNAVDQEAGTSMMSELYNNEEPPTSPRTHIKNRKEFALPHNAISSLCYVLWVRLDENLMKPLFGGSGLNYEQTSSLLRSEILKRTAHMSIWYMLTHWSEVQQIFEVDSTGLSQDYSYLYGSMFGDVSSAHSQSLVAVLSQQKDDFHEFRSFDDEFMENLVVDDEFFELSAGKHHHSDLYGRSVAFSDHNSRNRSGQYGVLSPIRGTGGGGGGAAGSNAIMTPIRRAPLTYSASKAGTGATLNNNTVANADTATTNGSDGVSVKRLSSNGSDYIDSEEFGDLYSNMVSDLSLYRSNSETTRSDDSPETKSRVTGSKNNCNTSTQGAGTGVRESIGDYFAGQLQGAITYQSSAVSRSPSLPTPTTRYNPQNDMHEV